MAIDWNIVDNVQLRFGGVGLFIEKFFQNNKFSNFEFWEISGLFEVIRVWKVKCVCLFDV